MKTDKKMIFNLPISKEQLRIANREIAKRARKGEKLQIEWKLDSA